MGSKLISAAAGAAILMSLLGATGASAATEFGDTCLGDGIASEYTLTTLSAPAGSLPLTAPSAGVITKVRVNAKPLAPAVIPTSVKTLRSTGGNSFLVTGQATVGVIGDSSAQVRLPVQAGDRLALRGQEFQFAESMVPSLTYYCTEEAGSVLGGFLGDAQPGSTVDFSFEAPNARVPVSAVVEPDADNDGFGDETQDKCPQGAALQTACPLVTIDSVTQVTRRSVRLLVATSQAAPVAVIGVVSLGKGKKATISAGPKTVPAGKLVGFTLKFPKKLKARLLELEPRKKLTLKITASATNGAGLVSTEETQAKLKGQGR
jgi:hypothetical protein